MSTRTEDSRKSWIEEGEAGPSNRVSWRDIPHLSPEVIVIGAGPAGCSLSHSLASSGRKVLLLERDLSEPDRIVGELLQPGGVAALGKLGLEGVLEGIDAAPVEGYCVVAPEDDAKEHVATGGEREGEGEVGMRVVGVPYPLMEKMIGHGEADMTQENGHSNGHGNGHSNGHSNGHANGINGQWHIPSSSGKKEGRSFHHGRLVSALRNRCYTCPNLQILESTARDLIFCPHTSRVIGVSVAVKTPFPTLEDPTATKTEVKSIYAPLTIIADGCFSKFRSTKGLRIPTPKTRSHFVGIILRDVKLPMQKYGTVCLTPEGPVLLYQIGWDEGEIRMLVDVKGKLPSVADGSLKNFIMEKYLPFMPSSLHESIENAISSQRLRTMPNSFLPPTMQGLSSSSSLSGAILVGDAWNMRHPLTGGGMTVAFNDAVILSEYLRPSEELPAGREGLENWDKIGERVREWFWRRKALAGTVNILSMALYDLFGAADVELAILREGCFQYFELGGECIAGPVGLLSGLTPKPLVLFYHFFAVALYAIYLLFTAGVPVTPTSPGRKPNILDTPWLVFLSGKVFWKACVVLLPVVFSEMKI